MHFTCLVTWNPYEVMDPFVFNQDWIYNEEKDQYEDAEWNSVEDIQTICDWFDIWWRWDWYIWVRDLNEDEPYKPMFFPALFQSEKWKTIDRSKLTWRASATKKNICWFASWKNSWCKKYPETFSYIDMNWEYHKMPEKFDFCADLRTYDWTEKTYDKTAYEKAKRKWRRDYIKWYKSIPDDEVLTIIDYHD